MNIIRVFFLVGTLFLVACATKDYNPESLKNYTAKQILAMGEQAMAKGDYKNSVKYFEAIDALYPFDREAQQGQLDVIYAYYKTEDYASALAAADRYIHLYPVGKHSDYAYYMKGIANFAKDRTWLQKLYTKRAEELDLSNLQDSFAAFELLVKLFPKSMYAQDAEKRMVYIRSLLARHELQVARFYFVRKAYVAAVNRASYLVKHFAGAPQVVAALKIMLQSYRALGAEKQANDTLRVLKLNFPQEV